jgi:xylulokinase
VSLATGSWHSFTLAVAPGYPPELVHDGVCVHPHPGPTGLGIFMGNPNGTCVIDWARRLTGLAIPDLEAGLLRETGGPGHLRADPSFSPLPEAPAEASLGGTITGFTLATSSVDLVRALMEAIAGRFSLALERLEQRGIASTLVRASGGGARSAWWMQLTADVAERPVEVVVPDEPGAFGAALLGGVGAGIYSSVSSAVHELVQVRHRYQPDRDRGALYAPVREMLSASRHDGAGAWPSAGSTTRRWPPRARNERCPDRTPRGAR